MYVCISDIIILIFVGLISGIFCVSACRVHRQYKRRLIQLRTDPDLPLSYRYRDLNGDKMPLVNDTSDDEFDVP